ncbi:MAG TPA: alpha/beta fold hydrolase [Candidatus Binataceae bacterium]|nr:alpha/beta fold hydrolase [Candidatus Binataceae bacterium]
MVLTEEGTSKFVQAGPLKLHYHEAGKGPVLIMIHGGGPGAGGWSNYRRNIDFFAEHFRVIAPDLPGFAKSDKPKMEGGMFAFFSKSIRDLMDALDIPRASFIGNSLGGGTTVKLALDSPDRADKLVMMGAGGSLPIFTPVPSEGIKHLISYYMPPGPSIEKLKAFLNVMVYDSSQLTDELIKERFAASTQPEILANPIFSPSRPVLPEPLWQSLNNLRQKTLLIWGRDDRTITLDNAFIMLNQIPDVRLHVFGRCGHWAQWEKAAEFNRLVLDFLTNE